MNKLIIALMATAFAGSVMAADVTVKGDAKADASTVTVKTEKPASAPKKARKHAAKKAAAKKLLLPSLMPLQCPLCLPLRLCLLCPLRLLLAPSPLCLLPRQCLLCLLCLQHLLRRSNSSFHEKPRFRARFFYVCNPRKVCHQRFRWPVTKPLTFNSCGATWLMIQPGNTLDLVALEPHELPK